MKKWLAVFSDDMVHGVSLASRDEVLQVDNSKEIAPLPDSEVGS